MCGGGVAACACVLVMSAHLVQHAIVAGWVAQVEVAQLLQLVLASGRHVVIVLLRGAPVAAVGRKADVAGEGVGRGSDSSSVSSCAICCHGGPLWRLAGVTWSGADELHHCKQPLLTRPSHLLEPLAITVIASAGPSVCFAGTCACCSPAPASMLPTSATQLIISCGGDRAAWRGSRRALSSNKSMLCCSSSAPLNNCVESSQRQPPKPSRECGWDTGQPIRALTGTIGSCSGWVPHNCAKCELNVSTSQKSHPAPPSPLV